MPVLILLILVDLAVVVLIMWAVVREPHHEITKEHPFVIAAREAAQKAQSVPAAAPAATSEALVETTEAPKTEDNA